jgi:hypothetical protein
VKSEVLDIVNNLFLAIDFGILPVFVSGLNGVGINFSVASFFIGRGLGPPVVEKLPGVLHSEVKERVSNSLERDVEHFELVVPGLDESKVLSLSLLSVSNSELFLENHSILKSVTKTSA